MVSCRLSASALLDPGSVARNMLLAHTRVWVDERAVLRFITQFGAHRTLYPHPVSKVRSLCRVRHM